MALTGKRALLTGGAAGIGLSTVQRLAEEGCKLTIFDIDQQQVESAISDLRQRGHDAIGCVGSVSEPKDVAAAFSACEATYGGIDILVNNAGVTGNCPSDELTLEMWQRVLNVNQTGTFLCSQAAARLMRQGGGGAIINLSSIYGIVGAPNRLAYGATKAAVVMMTKILAVEWAKQGIRVNCVAPGYVHTPGTAALADAGTIDLPSLERRTPQGRLANPTDIANAIVALCRDELEHVTGQVLAVDGGWTAYGYI